MMRRTLYAAAAVCVLAATPAAAATIYSQPLFNGPDGGPYRNDPPHIGAAGFALGGDADIARVSWYGAGLADEDFGAFRIRFYAQSDEAPAEPGDVVATTTSAVYSMTNTGHINSYGDRIFRFSMNIPTFHATGGAAYFVSVADIRSSNFIWSLSDRDCCSVFNMNGFGWSVDQARASNAFTLSTATGVPEPATWAMLVTAFMASGALLRRRRAVLA
jgi:hypothetical protein